MSDYLNLFELEAIAKAKLDEAAFGYYASGANDEISLRDNRAAFERIKLFYRVLVDVSTRDLATTVLGYPVSMPVLVAPTAFHKMAHPDGEAATARAAGAAKTIMMLSSLSNTDVEDVVQAASSPIFFQLYVYRDRKATEALIARVEAAGCRALVLTVDAPLLGRRERDVRNRFCLPAGLSVKNLVSEGYGDVPAHTNDSGLAAYFASLLDPSLTWKDLAWLRSLTKLPVIVKGIVRADDARRAVDCGASAIVVSNHGGRQLDTSPATIDALPAIADAVGKSTELLLDGGIRRGTDVIKAVALGARAVLVGRPVLWGLAADGERGVSRMLGILREELDLAMALLGACRMTEIGRDLLDGRA